jgi:hypothetical protein
VISIFRVHLGGIGLRKNRAAVDLTSSLTNNVLLSPLLAQSGHRNGCLLGESLHKLRDG